MSFFLVLSLSLLAIASSTETASQLGSANENGLTLTAVPASFDCPMRELALDFAQHIQPFLQSDKLQQIADALNGTPESRDCNVSLSPAMLARNHQIDDDDSNNIHSSYGYAEDTTVFVDYRHGCVLDVGVDVDVDVDVDEHHHSSCDGSIQKPFKYLVDAIAKLRSMFADTDTDTDVTSVPTTVLLRAGTHYIPDTIHLSSQDSHLRITNYKHEKVTISAAIPLECSGKWQLYKNGANDKNYYTCQVSANVSRQLITGTINGVRVNNARAIRARYPNGNPEVYPCGFCSSLKAKKWLPPTLPHGCDRLIHPATPVRSTGTDFQRYSLGVGGNCNNFVPNAGFWCTSGGGYTVPSGLVYANATLPHAPYANMSGAVVQTWRPGHWSSWMFTVGAYDARTNTIAFDKGGFQGARGNVNGDEFYVENVFEELDFPGEYFYNTTTRTLYYYNNESNADPSNLLFEATNLKLLFNLTGTSMAQPITNVEISGFVIKDTQYTYMDIHGMPSGGDWALDRIGAIYLDCTENIVIASNVFTRLDGNAISVNRYNRNVTVHRNEMVFLGGNAITLWGDTRNVTFGANGTAIDYQETSMGWDGTDGNQPRFVTFSSNFVHEIGIWEKQSSMYFQAKSCSNTIENNIFFNGPRAGINFNDGFGGNSSIRQNLVFNTCRESGDHGPFNSWDRQVYVTRVRNGTASTVKQFDDIAGNFIVANYDSRWAIDNDDGSCYYDVHDNFLVYGHSGLKSYAGGHNIVHHANIYGYIEADGNNGCVYDNADQLVGHLDAYFNNTCIMNQAKPAMYAIFHCQDAQNTWPMLDNNTIHIMSNDFSVTGACGLNEQAFQEKYQIDLGTVILGPPNDASIIEQAKAMLWQYS